MYRVEQVEAPLADETVCDINAFENALAFELDPESPPLPASTTRAFAEMHDPDEIATAFVARAPDARVVGAAWAFAPCTGNPRFAFCRLGVASTDRRRGVGTALLRAFVDFARAEDRTDLTMGADFFHAGGQAFADSLGAAVGYRAHVNRLLLHDVPDGLVQHWIDSAHSATGAVHDYELEWVPDSEAPETWLDDLCVVNDVLQNDAPMDDIPVGERRTTREQVVAHAERARAFGRDWWTLVARHRATGEPVGYTEMFFHHENPRMGSQGATAVSAAHRGHALGRWLKAAMLERVMREHPEITSIRTFNADSNDPMLAINFAMGFKPFLPARRWVIDRADAETWLEKRS